MMSKFVGAAAIFAASFASAEQLFTQQDDLIEQYSWSESCPWTPSHNIDFDKLMGKWYLLRQTNTDLHDPDTNECTYLEVWGKHVPLPYFLQRSGKDDSPWKRYYFNFYDDFVIHNTPDLKEMVAIQLYQYDDRFMSHFQPNGISLLPRNRAFERTVDYYGHTGGPPGEPGRIAYQGKIQAQVAAVGQGFKILDTDYKNYAIFYNCDEAKLYGEVDEDIWIYTREPFNFPKDQAKYDSFMNRIKQRFANKFDDPHHFNNLLVQKSTVYNTGHFFKDPYYKNHWQKRFNLNSHTQPKCHPYYFEK